MRSKDLSGMQKAAIFLMHLDKKDAASILKHLDPKQIQKLGLAMSTLNNIDKNIMDSVIKDFVNIFEDQAVLCANSDAHVKDVIVNALGEEKALGVLEKIKKGGKLTGLDTLKWVEPKEIFDLIKFEHPQIQTVILNYIGGPKASKVLSFFDDDIRVDLVTRIANLKNINPKALEELNIILDKNKVVYVEQKIKGVETAAEIINQMEPSIENKILEGIKNHNVELSKKIEDLMFVFEDLIKLDNLGIQRILREISSKQLLLALKGASCTIKDKIYSNMSKRAGDLLKDDLEAMPPVRITEVEKAQRYIIQVAKQLANLGELSLNNKNTREVI